MEAVILPGSPGSGADVGAPTSRGPEARHGHILPLPSAQHLPLRPDKLGPAPFPDDPTRGH